MALTMCTKLFKIKSFLGIEMLKMTSFARLHFQTLRHKYLGPFDLLSIILVPVIKDKAGKVNQKDNYRPIALASIASKMVETILLGRMAIHLETNCNQFGFKPQLGTDTCIYVLKEIVDKYRTLNSNIFMCFLDASKAFDRVKHSVLFAKLIRRGVPLYIVKLLSYWYSHQTMCVRWGNALSARFSVSNGVRQGGILSPYLFNIYIDDLSSALNTCMTGCLTGNNVINHLMYADDLVLLCPSAAGLQRLLKICELYSDEHAVLYNPRGVNLYVFHVSLTDFHCFDWLTYVRGNPYGFIKKKKKKLI